MAIIGGCPGREFPLCLDWKGLHGPDVRGLEEKDTIGRSGCDGVLGVQGVGA